MMDASDVDGRVPQFMHRKRLTIDSQAARLPLQESVRLADRTGIAFPKSDVGSQRLVSRGSLGDERIGCRRHAKLSSQRAAQSFA